MLFCLLLLLSPAGARPKPAPKGWVVTAADLLAVSPGAFRLDAAREKLSADQEFLGAFTVDYEYTIPNRLEIICECSRELSSLEAEVCYPAMNLASRLGLRDQEEVYTVKSVVAGDVSRCLRIRDRPFWAFSFRQKRYWGYLIVAGPNLTDQQIHRVVKNWVQRLARGGKR